MDQQDLADIQAQLRNVQKMVGKTVGQVQARMVPKFVHRMRAQKIHQLNVGTSVNEPVKLSTNVDVDIHKEVHAHKEAKRRMVRQEAKMAKIKHIRDEVKVAHVEAVEEVVAHDYADYHRRRGLQLAEVQAAIDKDKKLDEERQAKEQRELRSWREKYWYEKSKENRQISDIRQDTTMRALKTEFKESINDVYGEWSDRELARTRLQVEGNLLSAPIDFPSGDTLGVYGVPMEMGAYHATRGGHVDGLDQADTHVFDGTPQSTHYEEGVIKLQETSAELMKKEDLYNALKADSLQLEKSLYQMGELKSSSERDKRQVEQEIILVERHQAGPPRRLPTAAEALTDHNNKRKVVLLRENIEQLDHSILLASTKKKSIDSQILKEARFVSSLRADTSMQESKLDKVNEGKGNLPMVIGRNIASLPTENYGHDPFVSNPKQTFNAITHQSRYVSIKEGSHEALKFHKERVGMDQEIWVSRQNRTEMTLEAERTISRLVDISDRMKQGKIDSDKLSLVEAVKAFQSSGTSLWPSKIIYTGPLPWWTHRNTEMSSPDDAVVAYRDRGGMGGITFEEFSDDDEDDFLSFSDEESLNHDGEVIKDDPSRNGVTLGDAHHGMVLGIIDLPKSALWSVSMTVSRQGNGEEYSTSDESDFVKVSLGISYPCLVTIGTYYNTINPDTGAVLYDIKYIFTGKRLAYKFEFSSSIKTIKKHLAVSTGVYEEFEMKPLEAIADPAGKRRERVISSFVKMIRIEEGHGKLRMTKLIEELMSAEESSLAYWDSDVVSRTPQRYDRIFFLRIIRAEILLENKSTRSVLTDPTDVVHADEKKELGSIEGSITESKAKQMKIAKSAMLYLQRKQQLQQHVVDKGKKEIGRRIDIYDQHNQSWRHVIVRDCIVEWVELGTQAKVTHEMQECNEVGEVVGKIFVANLSKLRYFDSAVQVFDEQARFIYSEKKLWVDKLDKLKSYVEKALGERRTLYDGYNEREETAFKKEEEKSLAEFEATIEDTARGMLTDKAVKHIVKMNVQGVLLDMRKGLIKPDLYLKPKKQAYLVSQDRFVQVWSADRRNDLIARLDAKKAKISKRISDRHRELARFEARITEETAEEIKLLEENIREQKKIEKDAIKAKVRFDPQTFQKAVVQPLHCEHLKTKAWGSNYATGVRCVSCGKELSNIHEEESQVLGYGTGSDPWMHDAVIRHRKHEQSFRFKQADELVRIEKERIRLEKERRLMDENEIYFNDFSDLQCIYEFDQRHKKAIKQNGIFRQGLQWTEVELDAFVTHKTYEEKERLETNGLLIEEGLKKFDAFAKLDNPPPTFRAEDERKKSNYVQLLFAMGRLHNFQKKIVCLKDERSELLNSRSIFAEILYGLHKNTFVFNNELGELEADLDKTGRLLATYNSMEILWAQSNKILHQANKEKRRAEMRYCGLWDDVRDCSEEVSFLRDETKNLLRVKHLYEVQLEQLESEVKICNENVKDAQAKWIAGEAEANSMIYCKPGETVSTRYGDALIRGYRASDNMLMCQLTFGTPLFKLWIHADEIINQERSKQQSELMIMQMEDDAARQLISTERIMIKRELLQMRKEEYGLKEVFAFQDLGQFESKLMEDSVTEALNNSYGLMQTKAFKKNHKKFVKDSYDRFVSQRAADNKNYVGPPTGRPPILTSAQLVLKKKEIDEEMKMTFMKKACQNAENKIKARLLVERSTWLENDSFEALIVETATDMILCIAEESIHEGRVAKLAAEKTSCIYVSNPPWMQYATYCHLTTMWKQRKLNLTANIEKNRGLASKTTMEIKKKKRRLGGGNEEEDRIEREAKAARKAARKEVRRQQKLCNEMTATEVEARAFYHWELLENLRERRDMKIEDKLSKELVLWEKKLKELKASAYAVDGNSVEKEMEKSKITNFDKRRKELKEATIEKRRLAEEVAHMVIEDKAGLMLREIDLAERQKRAYDLEFGIDEDESEDGDSEGKEKGDLNMVRIPPWMKEVPPDWMEWTFASQTAFVKLHDYLRTANKRIRSNVVRDTRRLDVYEDKNFKEWEGGFSILNQKQLETELEYMQCSEASREKEVELVNLRDNLRKMMVFCRRKGEEELKAKTRMNQKEAIARRHHQEVKDAVEWLHLCEKRSKHRDKLKRRVTSSCKWVDTVSINGFHQRFKTELLRERLYFNYFNKIVSAIVNRAETIATERKLFGIQESLSFTKEALEDRIDQMKKLWRDMQRGQLLCMRRSALNKTFFSRHRTNTLRTRFSGWVRFYYWNRGHREAFELKYEVLRRKMQLQRQFKDQLNYGSKPGIAAMKDIDPSTMQLKKATTVPTTIERHKNRIVECKNCLLNYLESNNTSMSCEYHSGSFVMGCPKSCPNPGLTPLCTAHKRRRWVCCDATRQDVIGCCRRHHVPFPNDPIYQSIMEKLNERDADFLSTLDAKAEKAYTDNWPRKAYEIKRHAVHKVEDGIQFDRDTAERYEQIKFV